MLAAFAAAAALAANVAPVTVPYRCVPGLDRGVTGGPPATALAWSDRVELSPWVCHADLWLTAGRGGRAAVARRLGLPGTVADEAGEAGAAALITLHEAEHASGVADESGAECGALALLPHVLARYLQGANRRAALAGALAWHEQLPESYRNCG